ncbi:MAG TPA: DUF4340 domain-containing protein [Thermoanaerobaculia bacterium]
MRPRTVLVLAVLVAALAAFLWFVERDLPSSEELAERSKKVLPVEPGDVRAMTLEWDGETVRLERAPVPGVEEGGEGADEADEEDGGAEADEPAPSPDWRLAAPLEGRADRAAVEGLITAVGELEKLRTLEDAEPGEVGLEPPRGRLVLLTDEGERTLLVGADVPASENVLVALEGEPEVWVTRRSFLARLEKEPGEWRSKDVLSVPRDRIARLTLRAAGREAPVVLARGDDGRFRLEAPVADLADADLVDGLLSDLVNLRARRFLDEGAGGLSLVPADLGLEPPRGVVEAELEGGGGPVRVELGRPVDGAEDEGAGAPEAGAAVYARTAAGPGGAQLFETQTGLDEAVARPPEEWRSPAWTGLRSHEVDRLEVAEPGRPELVLARDGVDWRRGGEEIPYTAASDFLFAVTEAEGEVAEAAADGLGEPVLSIRLASGEGAEEILTLYPPPPAADAPHPATSSAREAVLLLPAEAVTGLREALAAVRAAEAAPAAEEADDEAEDAAE